MISMRIVTSILMVFFIITVGEAVFTEDTSAPSSIRFSGIPALGFGPDSGFGFGALGSMYVDQEGYSPYKMALGLKIYLTTKGVNSHAIQLDQVRAFGLPLRLITRLGFYSIIAQNYCGRASEADCDENRPINLANRAGLSQDERTEFINHFYKNRFLLFYGDISSRWLLWKDQAKLEFMVNYHGSYYMNRDFKKTGPYEGSLYARDFASEKDGYLSTLEFGLMLDKRDNEPALPVAIGWNRACVGLPFLTGSAWDYFGANAAFRIYLPLDDDHRLVIANQSIADIIVGDLPLDAMSRIGGSQALNEFTAIGGQYIGRGIKEQGYVGRIRVHRTGRISL